MRVVQHEQLVVCDIYEVVKALLGPVDPEEPFGSATCLESNIFIILFFYSPRLVVVTSIIVYKS